MQRESVYTFLTETLQAKQITPSVSNPGQIFFACPKTGKRFACLQFVSKRKLGQKSIGYEEIITLRCDPLLSGSLRLQKGFLTGIGAPAEHWISIRLDHSVPDETIFSLLTMAMDQSSGGTSMVPRQWLIPANPKYFDLFAAFEKNDTILWKQSSSVSVGDIIYLYVALPYSAIMFRCRAVEVDIPYTKKNSNRRMTRAMRIQRLHTYEQNDFPLSRLKIYGITTVRGPRGIPTELRIALDHTANEKE